LFFFFSFRPPPARHPLRECSRANEYSPTRIIPPLPNARALREVVDSRNKVVARCALAPFSPPPNRGQSWQSKDRPDDRERKFSSGSSVIQGRGAPSAPSAAVFPGRETSRVFSLGLRCVRIDLSRYANTEKRKDSAVAESIFTAAVRKSDLRRSLDFGDGFCGRWTYERSYFLVALALAAATRRNGPTYERELIIAQRTRRHYLGDLCGDNNADVSIVSDKFGLPGVTHEATNNNNMACRYAKASCEKPIAATSSWRQDRAIASLEQLSRIKSN